MADNVTLPATGIIFGTETVTVAPNGPAQVQQVKVLFGAVDTGTEISTASPLPVVQTGVPALATGAATTAAQATGNTSAASIDSKTPALGQSLAIGAVPVVLTALQQAALTPATASFGAVAPASGTGVGFTDGTNMRLATVTQNHNGDNQLPPSTGYGILVSSNSGVLNPGGTVDRTRGTGFDGVPAVGIPAGNQYLQGPLITTTITTNPVVGSANSQTITVSSTASMLIGDLFRTSDNPEPSQVGTIPSGTTFTAVLKNNHAVGAILTWAHYNVARDASIGDNQLPIGFSASATYLFNSITGLMELDKSAAGELDGASGRGAATAAEYEWNAGGPVNNIGFSSGLQYDRARSLQAKGLGVATQTAGNVTAGNTSLPITVAASSNTLQPGQQIRIDRGTATEESAYVVSTYVPGTSPLTLQSTTAFAHNGASIEWDVFASGGPGLNGFTAAGIGIEEEALYDPVTGKYFIERAATQDAMPPQNIVAECGVEWNGASFDRMRTPGVWKTVAAVAVTAGTPVAIWTPAGGKKFRVMGFALSSSVAGSIILKDNTAEWIRTPLLLASTPFQTPPNMDNGFQSVLANNALFADVTASGTISGFVFGTEE